MDSAIFKFLTLAGLTFLFASCARDREHQLLISIPQQRMLLLKHGTPIGVFPVSTSKFGVGDHTGSYDTPLGHLEVAAKFGENAPSGEVFKSRKATGEVVRPNSPGRDPIVTRIFWLRGMEDRNRAAYTRCIYIHGTPEERNLGKPVSFGCIRMKSSDVINLFDTVGIGARVDILTTPLPEIPALHSVNP
jgi:hypothetical protein